ncbi:MAG: alkaline shock response membrane anchor protein AmaP [Peptostreptococcus sp.]|uniref:alkaline shock response membrane anchor protein AmaP n=1 Tax=Peptostreptococcus sp. TaxID=1262 RepID=UPI001CB33137|nr:alkaline shock response membrane anchor protein AmaP [Peptostreptococcus sp.]MBF1044269.1 alkaline shock response membrane anchor protein AmaP [Peptostreptococcus sp.]
MSTFRKIINLIYFLILVCLLIVLYSMAFDLEFMKTLVDAIRDNASYTLLVNIGLVLVLGVTCLRTIYILFKKSYDSYLLIFEDEGAIRISDKSIERTIRYAASQIGVIDQLDIKVKARNKNDAYPDVKVNIKCGLDYSKYMESEYFTEDVYLEGQEFTSQGSDQPTNKAIEVDNDQINLDKATIQTDNSQADEYTQDRAQAIGMTGLTNMIQEELHKAVENFIGQRVDQINIKFYDVEKKNKADKPRKAPRKSKTGTEIRGKAKRVK